MQNYYYSSNDKSLGPFSLETLKQMAAAGIISDETLVIQEGKSDWVSYCQLKILPDETSEMQAQSYSAKKALTTLADKLSDASGLEKLEGFSIQNLFSAVFKKHSPEEVEEHFISGTAKTTPNLSDVLAVWPTPWAFVRLLFISLILFAGFYFATLQFENYRLIPGFLFVGCFGIPFSVLVFFMEINILHNISFYRVSMMMLLGGLLSLIISLFLFRVSDNLGDFGAMISGPIEETGKLLAVVYISKKWSNKNWILNGLLLGAAVGTGFEAFEDAGYCFRERLRDNFSLLTRQ